LDSNGYKVTGKFGYCKEICKGDLSLASTTAKDDGFLNG